MLISGRSADDNDEDEECNDDQSSDEDGTDEEAEWKEAADTSEISDGKLTRHDSAVINASLNMDNARVDNEILKVSLTLCSFFLFSFIN